VSPNTDILDVDQRNEPESKSTADTSDSSSETSSEDSSEEGIPEVQNLSQKEILESILLNQLPVHKPPNASQTPLMPVPKEELEFNPEGPPNDGIKFGGANPELEAFLLQKYLAENSGVHPPTKVTTAKDGQRYRTYCFPGSSQEKMRRWCQEYFQSKGTNKT